MGEKIKLDVDDKGKILETEPATEMTGSYLAVVSDTAPATIRICKPYLGGWK